MLLLAVFFPIAAGLLLFATPKKMSGRVRACIVEGVTLATSLIALYCLLRRGGEIQQVFTLLPGLPIAFRIDGVGGLFTALVAFLWPLSTLYGFEYMEHVGGQRHFFALYTITYGVTLGIAMAANLLTMYIFYEFLTICTLPLVMHGSSAGALRAGRQYMMYTFFGEAVSFAGVMIALVCGEGGTFVMGGTMSAFAAAHPALLQAAYLCMFIGFGVKAAVFPMHAWLPTAAVAPTPVTALLHAVAVVKAGAFAIIRATYFVVGAQLLRGTLSQAVALVLTSVTIVYGSVMAVREHHFKRRLAYSTVSNLSYIVFAACLMTQAGLIAGLSHMLFHALIKITLFFCAGAVLVKTGRTQIESLRGLFGVMPATCAVYTLAALALSGAPILPGFVSKLLIGQAAIDSGSPFGVLGVAALLISAVLTAIYLLTLVFAMAFRPLSPDGTLVAGEKRDPSWRMLVPLFVLSAAIVLCGLFSNAVVSAVTGAVGEVM